MPETQPTDGSAAETTAATPPEPSPGVRITLRSLAAHFEEEQHRTYVRHLNEAVADSSVKNIALTGRYGSGKSSVLDKFVSEQEAQLAHPDQPSPDGAIEKVKRSTRNARERARGVTPAEQRMKKVLRISINTLGPDQQEGLTNRIQKELVKQLVYRAAPGEIRRSQFARSKELTPDRAAAQSLGAGLVLICLFRLFGVWPEPHAMGSIWQWIPGALFALLVLVVVWVGRKVIGTRLVSEFSTGGTSIKLEKKSATYFDEYLDEIMAFFDTTEPDIVVFEDLDRFDDDRIFDSLRELNTLINASAHWKDRSDRPLRFIYAIKDSLFEKLGDEPEKKKKKKKKSSPTSVTPSQSRDIAEAAVERANRTKFFEVVIPVVPFLSHSNARDLLTKALTKLKLPDVLPGEQDLEDAQARASISRALVDIVARHTTDMRLLLNICNEYVVFGERLLWVDKDKRAPGMTADDLFAMVVYKNFHLADFEALPQRGSALDTLGQHRRELVDSEIERLQGERSEAARIGALQRKQVEILEDGAHRFDRLHRARSIQHIVVDGTQHPLAAVHDADFWKSLATAESLKLPASEPGYQLRYAEYGREDLLELFPQAMDPAQWRELDEAALASHRAEMDRSIAFLRGADFAQLVRDTRFTHEGTTFADLVTTTLGSALARDLVRGGFIDRYYAEYATAFYGNFLGVDVANFFRNSIWPNEMDIYYVEFTGPASLRNVLAQAPADFTSSRSVFNISVIDYLVKNDRVKAKEAVSFFVAEEATDDARRFFRAYFTTPAANQEALVELLAEHPWPPLFIRAMETVPTSDQGTRTSLLDAALGSATDEKDYAFDESVTSQIRDSHEHMVTFTEQQSPERTEVVLGFIERAFAAGVPDLAVLASPLRQRVIDTGQYVITAHNLRVALLLRNDQQVSLEQVRQNERVWDRCRGTILEYLDEVVDLDDATDFAVFTPETLRELLIEQSQSWTMDQWERLLQFSDPDAALSDITDEVPDALWPAIVAAGRMTPSGHNLHAYAAKHGVDAALAASVIGEDGTPVALESLDDLDPVPTHDLLVRILNASAVLGPENRIALAAQLDPDGKDPVQATELEPTADFLERLLDAGRVPDTLETFQHFLTAGWPAIATAFRSSAAAPTFLTPELVEDTGAVVELLKDNSVREATRDRLVNDLAEFVPDDTDTHALRAVATYAHARRIALPLLQVQRLARVTQGEPGVVLWQLVQLKDASAEEIIDTLVLLGDKFAAFRDAKTSFDLPESGELKQLLDRLRTAGRIQQHRAHRGGRRVYPKTSA